MLRKPKLGLALGGGGARGLAHIGILKVLEREGIPIDIITGSSAGSLIGAMYALNPNVQFIENKIRRYLNSQDFKKTGIERVIKRKEVEGFLSQVVTHLKERIVINLAHSRVSLVSNKRLTKSLGLLLSNDKIENTNIPLGIVASDLISGRDILLSSGNIIDAVSASSSLPGFLPPMQISEFLFIDGCITQPVPVKAAYDMGADVVIAVNVSQDLDRKTEFENIIDIMTRTSQMTSHFYNLLQLEKADLVIRPQVGHFHWSEFDQIDYIIEQGRDAIESVFPDIRKLATRRYLFMKKIKKRRIIIQREERYLPGRNE